MKDMAQRRRQLFGSPLISGDQTHLTVATKQPTAPETRSRNINFGQRRMWQIWWHYKGPKITEPSVIKIGIELSYPLFPQLARDVVCT